MKEESCNDLHLTHLYPHRKDVALLHDTTVRNGNVDSRQAKTEMRRNRKQYQWQGSFAKVFFVWRQLSTECSRECI